MEVWEGSYAFTSLVLCPIWGCVAHKWHNINYAHKGGSLADYLYWSGLDNRGPRQHAVLYMERSSLAGVDSEIMPGRQEAGVGLMPPYEEDPPESMDPRDGVPPWRRAIAGFSFSPTHISSFLFSLAGVDYGIMP